MARGFLSRVRISMGAVALVVAVGSCSSGLGAQADDAFQRLAATVPWSLADEPGAHGVCSDIAGTEMCGPFILRVRATDDVVLGGLPDVVRTIGFSNNVRVEGCLGCPQERTVIGVDGAGRELAITVYSMEAGLSMLDAYVSAAHS